MVLNTKSPLIVCGTALTDELFHLTIHFTLHTITVYLHYTVLQCIYCISSYSIIIVALLRLQAFNSRTSEIPTTNVTHSRYFIVAYW